MRKMLALVVCTLTIPAFADAQDKNWKKTLEQALEQSVYKRSRISNLEINNVTEPGTVLVVRKDGLVADRSHAFGTAVTRIKVDNPSAPSGLGAFLSRSSSTTLKQGEKVYIYDVDINDDNIILNLLTLDSRDITQKGNTEHTRLKSSVRFDFDKAFLPTAAPEVLKKVFDAILLPEAEASAPKTVSLGQSFADVEAVLGKPTTIIDLGPKKTYVYPTMRVIFTNGKVADVQ